MKLNIVIKKNIWPTFPRGGFYEYDDKNLLTLKSLIIKLKV